MQRTPLTLSLIAAATLTLVACGGGGGGGSDTSTPTATTPTTTTPTSTTAALTPVSTKVMDGLIQGATVCADTNANGVCEPSEPQATTNAAGVATVNVPTAQVNSISLVAEVPVGAIDADTGAVKTRYTLKVPAGQINAANGQASAVISALTNQVAQQMGAANQTREAAEAAIKAQLGLSGSTASLMDDYVGQRDNDADHKKMGDIARLLVLNTQASTAANQQTGCVSTTTASSNFEGNEGQQSSDDGFTGAVTPTATTTAGTPVTTTTTVNSDDANKISENERENHVERNLLGQLAQIRQDADDAEQACGSGKIAARDCDGEMQKRVRTVAACQQTATPVAAPAAGTASAPAGTASAPATTASAPATTASAPATTASAPTTTASAPATTASTPATTTPTTPATQPTTQTASATAGKASYDANCASCHGATRATAFNKLLNAGPDAARIQWAIANNRGGMSYLASTVDATVAANIAAYIASSGF